MSHVISRRTFAAGSIASILGGGTMISAPLVHADAAQGKADLARLGLPALDITVTPEGFEGAPNTFNPGRYLLTVTLAEGVEESGVTFLQPPAGMSMDQFLEEVGHLFIPESEASPGAEEEEEEILATPFYQAVWAGGVHIL